MNARDRLALDIVAGHVNAGRIERLCIWYFLLITRPHLLLRAML